MTEANKETVRRYFEEIFNRKNLAACDEIVAEDYLEHAVAPFGQSAPERVNGPESVRETAEWLLAQFPDLHMTIEALITEEDTVAVRVRSEGNEPRVLQWRAAAHGEALRGVPEPLVPR